ncbi:OmpH family outer membrane protein [Pedobacter changchengzhani]|uniref:OmpH family outer membrane protein n=1 Tax=Pedobacter changchengzhani TaxID=2529274 RepID=A0A4R5MHS7_9SPHI|nr:OmpH family outer membrane protein [Pedobacter changchengzhani]TDG35117.1 OmpH family outer membrane protein [Pedobacter changchengzhani]
MRKLINVFFVATGLLFTANIANAQQKVGHINSEEVFSNLPEAKAAQVTLEALGKTKQADIDGMIKEYQTKLAVAQAKEKTLSEANKEVVGKELQTAGAELQDLEKRITDARTKASQEVGAKQGELFQPIQAKVANAISSVAKEKGLAYVFDIANGQGGNNLVYWEGGDDITASVKAKLNITATAKPAAPKK